MEKSKVLIVDDIRENVLVLSELLADENVQIYSAYNAEDALNHIVEHEFALALLDVQMPVTNGFELARLIRGVNRSRHLPVIFVTAQQETRDILFEGYESGAVDLLFKPLDPYIVRSKVRTFIKIDQQNALLCEQMEKVKELRRKAEEASTAKSQFLANMSHEIRTPLSSVLGFSEVLSQNSLDEKEREECVGAIRRNADLLLHLIDDILDLSRIEAHQIKLNESEFYLENVLNDIESSLGLRATQKGIHLRVDRAFDDQVRIFSDPMRIKQVLLNVVGNAIKFTERGAVTVQVRVEPLKNAEEGACHLVFEVRDTGVGMTLAETQKIFKPFSQADDSNRRRFGGSGLGLVIAQQLAQSMQGNLRLIHSEVGVGSFFQLVLKTQLISDGRAQDLKPLVEIVTGSLKDRIILVVDDVSDNRILIARYLKNTGAQVLLASSGSEAVKLAASEHPDLILMDIQMPDMDGYEATQRIREQNFSGPILALTAHVMKEDVSRCFASGCDEVIMKPAKRNELINLMTEYIQRKSFSSSRTVELS